MKTIKSILAGLVLILSVPLSVVAQSQAKVIAVVNQATWCPVCQKNGTRAMSTFMKDDKNGAIQFVTNDLTNNQTKEKSAVQLKKLGLDQAMNPYKGTGMVYFFNAENKTLISHVSMAKSNQELADALMAAEKDVH